MEKNSVTIERDGITLTLVEAGETDGQYTLKVGADTNDADYIYEECHYTREAFNEWHVLGMFVLLSQMVDRHFYELDNLVSFYGGEYEMEEALGIPTGSGDWCEPHSVSEVELTYFEGGSTYKFFPETIDDKKKIVEDYLEWSSKEYSLSSSCIHDILKELF